MKKSIMALVVALPTIGMAQVDPVQSFEKIVSTCQSAFDARPPFTLKFDERTSEWIKYQELPAKITYDVRKTDSLVAPVAGILNVEEATFMGSSASEETAGNLVIPLDTPRAVLTKTAINLSFQGGRWLVKGAKETMYSRRKPRMGFDADGYDEQITRDRLKKGTSIWPKCLALAE
jgi:hypothetical protein